MKRGRLLSSGQSVSRILSGHARMRNETAISLVRKLLYGSSELPKLVLAPEGVCHASMLPWSETHSDLHHIALLFTFHQGLRPG